MAEDAQVPECNENENPEIIPVEITDVVDQVDTTFVCETSQSDSVLTSESSDTLLEDKISTQAMDLNDQHEGEKKGENSIIFENVPDVLDNHEKMFEGNKEGGCQTRLEIDSDTAPVPSPEDISKRDKDQDGLKTETPDILLYQESQHPSESGTEETLTETEEENTSIETDTEDGDVLYDEQENGPQQSRAVSGSHLESSEMAGSRPEIPMHSCSGYDTVSYRKIRRGNTKQRIDEFESMMNL